MDRHSSRQRRSSEERQCVPLPLLRRFDQLVRQRPYLDRVWLPILNKNLRYFKWLLRVNMDDRVLKLRLQLSTMHMCLTVPQMYFFVNYSQKDDGLESLSLRAAGSPLYAWIHTWRQRWRTTQIAVICFVAAGVCHLVVSVLQAGSRKRARKAIMHDWKVLWTTWKWDDVAWND